MLIPDGEASDDPTGEILWGEILERACSTNNVDNRQNEILQEKAKEQTKTNTLVKKCISFQISVALKANGTVSAI